MPAPLPRIPDPAPAQPDNSKMPTITNTWMETKTRHALATAMVILSYPGEPRSNRGHRLVCHRLFGCDGS
jgi:hypothetical protein